MVISNEWSDYNEDNVDNARTHNPPNVFHSFKNYIYYFKIF